MEEFADKIKIPVLEDTEPQLFGRYNKNSDDVELRNEIVGKYLYLAEIISKKFINRGVDHDDIYQVAGIALIKAVERFDLSHGVKFVSFATPTIIGEIKRFFRDKASTIRIPRRIYEAYQKVNSAREQLTQQLNRNPRIGELASVLDMSEESVLEILESNNVHNMQSFDHSVYDNDDLELHEVLGEEDTTYNKIDNRDFILKSLDRFNEAEREFIKQRYIMDKTQKEIAEIMGVSQMYVSRMEKKVLERFRNILTK